MKELANELEKAIAPSDVGGGPLAVAHDRIAALERELAEQSDRWAGPLNQLISTKAALERELAVAKDMAVSAIGKLAEAKKDTAGGE